MPQIPTYNTPAQESELRIPDSGAATMAQAGRRLGTLGNETASAYRTGFGELAKGVDALGKSIETSTTNSQVSKAPLLIAQDQSSRLDDLNKIAMTTDPADITGKVDQYISDNMGEAKDAYMANFTTRAAKTHAEALWDRHEANIYNHASAVSYQASLDQNHNNLVGSVNTLSETAGAHPSTLDTNLDLIDSTVDAQLKSLPAHQRDAFDTTFRNEAKTKALAASLKTLAFGSPDGSIPPNPAAAKTALDSGKYDSFLSAGNKSQLSDIVKLGEHQAGVDRATAATAQQQAAEKRSDDTVGQYFNSLPQLGGQPVPNFGMRVLHDDNILPEDKTALIKASTALSNGPAPTTNPMTLDHMITRLTSNDKPSNADILNQVTAGNLGLADAQFLMGQDPNSPALHQLQTTLNEGKAGLVSNRGSGIMTPAAAQAYQRFQQFAVNAYKSGEPIDAKSMPDVLERFKPTGADAVAAIPEQDRPAAPRHGLVRGGALDQPPTDAQLPHLVNFESSDRNVTNPTATSSGHAEGYAQITTGTWKDFAPANVQAKYPTPSEAPKEVQLAVAKLIPLRRWAPETLDYLRKQGVLG